MNCRALALIEPEDQSPSLTALESEPTWIASATASKSAATSTVDPENPDSPLISIQQVRCVRNGFVPETVPRRRRNVALTTVAPSGMEDVSNETKLLFSFSLPP